MDRDDDEGLNEAIFGPVTEEKAEAEKRGGLTQKAILLTMSEICQQFNMTESDALRLAIQLAARNHEAAFHFAKARDDGSSDHNLGDTYRGYTNAWERALAQVMTQGDTTGLSKLLTEDAQYNQSRSSREPDTMNFFGRQELLLAKALPPHVDPKSLGRYIPRPAWEDDDVIEAPMPNMTRNFQMPPSRR